MGTRPSLLMLETTPRPIREESAPEAARPARWPGASPGSAFAWALLVASAAGWIVYGRVTGYVYSEFSDYATQFGSHPWYHALGFGQILSQYVHLGHGWYRPTGFYLIPYLLRLDYFQPGEQMTVNIATLVIAATMVTIFLTRPRPLIAVATALVTLLAPALYLVPYGAQADSFYIIFGLAFLWIADRLLYGHWHGWRRRAWWAALVLAYLLTITTKEVGSIVSLLAVPFLLVRGPAFTREQVVRVLRFLAPFIVASIAFAIVYRLNVSAVTATYSTHPSLGRVLNFINLVCWTLGFRSPRHTYLNWVPGWSSTETIVQALVFATVVAGVAVGWRRIGLWRIGVFVATFLLTAMAIAAVGGIPYHAYPLVIMYALAFAVAARELAVFAGRLPGLAIASGAGLVALIAAMVVQGHQTFGGVLFNGPQTPYLMSATELFDGPTLDPVRDSSDPLLVFQDCLGGLHNPLKYFARASSGSQIVVTGAFSYPAVKPAMQQAFTQGRPVFAALCTGSNSPWYVLRRYAGPRRGLVAAAP